MRTERSEEVEGMRTFLYTQGTRVRVRPGPFPIDPGSVGREGVVVEIDEYRPGRYGVTLDGETEIRDFAEEELEPLAGGKEEAHLGDTGPGIGPGNA